MKTLLILGGYGFIGTNIIKYIDQHLIDKYRVIVFDRTDSHPHHIQFQSVIKSYSGNFQDTTLFDKIFDENKIDNVLHLISATFPANSQNPHFDIEANLIPTVDFIQSMINHQVYNITFLSSGGAIYGNALAVEHKESDDTFPISSYGVIKLAIEKYMFQFSSLYGLKPLILRLSNPYGPYHYSTKQGIINVSLRKAHNQEQIEIWGNGNTEKDYIYVNDFCNILFKLLEKESTHKILNIASGEILSLNCIIEKVKELVPGTKCHHTNSLQNDVQYVSLSTQALKEEIGQIEFTPFSKGIIETNKWLLEDLENTL